MKCVRAVCVAAGLIVMAGCSSTEHAEKPVQMSKLEATSPEAVFYSEVDARLQMIEKNRNLTLSRLEQIKLAVDAAIADRVEPILMEQPREKLVYFVFSESRVEEKWTTLLKKHVDYLHSDKSIRLMVAGFTDSKGTAKFNLKLGQKRADNVCAKLVELGARKEQLTCVSYGESHPADPGNSNDARARNRRAEFLY
ncbi:TPA: OmpA family protein [Vibrio parahaemolyticus]|uniref:OmpA family protein n=1 Tax=Vibrio campbellii TaxID=680 RepID=UPI001F0871E6|nr:OmpA family protein [Vibrio campbellii]UMM06569.1 OmpA family protein [Vibrio campbellii]